MGVLSMLLSTFADYIIMWLLGALCAVLIFFGTKRRREEYLHQRGYTSGRIREITMIIFSAYIGGLIMILFFPPGFFDAVFGGLWLDFPNYLSQNINLVPTILFYLTGEYTGGSWIYAMFIGNILMFIPIGFFASLLWEISKKKFLLIYSVSIIIVETLQLLVGRSFDSNDIILNILGGAFGCIIASVLEKVEPRYVVMFRYKNESDL